MCTEKTPKPRREVFIPPEDGKAQKFLYCNKFGGLFLKIFKSRTLSKIVGKYLDSGLSKGLIKNYIKKNGIDMNNFVDEKYRSFNTFFTRRIKPELRPVDTSDDAFISPCDGKLTVFAAEDNIFRIKNFDYTVQSLLKNDDLAEKYRGGLIVIIRLCVTDYHRYIFLDDGEADGNTFIKGKLHTVQPIASDRHRIYTENCREYTVLHTKNFGDVVQIEVGAMMVGRIVNEVKQGKFSRGDEKGRFEFGGSTVALLIEKDRVLLDEEFFENTANGLETEIKCGEKIGVKIK